MTARQSQSGQQSQKYGSTQQSKTTAKPKKLQQNQQPRTTQRHSPANRYPRPMTPEPKRPHVVIGFLDRCTAWYKRLPLLWQIIVAIALVVGGVLAAPYLFHLIIGLVMDFCIFGLLILFMIGMVGSLFGKGHRNNHDDDWWDEMMDDARGNGPHHVDFHF